MSGPIFSLKFVHDAIAAQLQDFVTRAIAAKTCEDLGSLAGDLDYFCEVMHFHHQGEEEGVFPLLEGGGAGLSSTYLFDHERETKALAELRQSANQAQAGQDVDVASFQRSLCSLAEAGFAHIEKENTLVLPWLAAHFSPAEQGEIVGKVIGAIPKDKMPGLVPWVISRLSVDDAERYVRGLQAGMPAPVFVAAKGWIEGGVAAPIWTALVGRIPELAA